MSIADNSLPAGTLLPKGANFAMQSTIDFGMHLPVSTPHRLRPVSLIVSEWHQSTRRVPAPGESEWWGVVIISTDFQVSVVKKKAEAKKPPASENPLCVIQ